MDFSGKRSYLSFAFGAALLSCFLLQTPVRGSAIPVVIRRQKYDDSDRSISISVVETVSASSAPVVQQQPADGKGGNPIASFLGYIKNSIVKTVDGCGQLWKNHGTCKEIRSKLQTHREGLASSPQYANMDPKESKKILSKIEGGISYEEYVFLQKGKEDRGKLMNVVFLMFGAPRFLPYALLFNPEMLPSPFLTPNSEGVMEKKSREMSSAVISCLLRLESDARQVPAMAKLNIFGGKKQEERMKSLQAFNDRVAELLNTPEFQNREGARLVLKELDDKVYRPLDKSAPDSGAFNRRDQRLCQLAPSLVKGLADTLGNSGIMGSITPNFLNRGKLVSHAQKVADADFFLVNANIDLDSIPWPLLQEACVSRMRSTSGSSPDELRNFLREWLQLVVQEPASRSEYHFNGNLARTALMGYNSLQSTRDPRSSQGVLPRLLFRDNGSAQRASFVAKEPKIQQTPQIPEKPQESLQVPKPNKKQRKRRWLGR